MEATQISSGGKGYSGQHTLRGCALRAATCDTAPHCAHPVNLRFRSLTGVIITSQSDMTSPSCCSSLIANLHSIWHSHTSAYNEPRAERASSCWKPLAPPVPVLIDATEVHPYGHFNPFRQHHFQPDANLCTRRSPNKERCPRAGPAREHSPVGPPRRVPQLPLPESASQTCAA